MADNTNNANANDSSTGDKNIDLFMRKFEIAILSVGLLGLVITGILSCCSPEKVLNGSIPAMSFLIIILGMCFAFPTLLQESVGTTSNGVSTMRVVVLIVVLVFGVVYIKLGWLAGSFEDFHIDESWIYILGLAFGGKALQKFGENGTPTPPLPPPGGGGAPQPPAPAPPAPLAPPAPNPQDGQ